MRMEFVIRFDYGSIVPWVSKSDEGLRDCGPDTLLLRTPVATRGEELTTVAEFIVAEGEQTPFVLCWHRSHDPCPREVDAAELIQFTEDWSHPWSGRCKYNGPWRSVVMRSLITLKALTYAPTGGLVAAPTTSLPEQLGGVEIRIQILLASRCHVHARCHAVRRIPRMKLTLARLAGAGRCRQARRNPNYVTAWAAKDA